MWMTESSTVCSAPPAAVWALWSDVERWNVWDRDVVWSKIDGPFALGTKGSLKPAGGPRADFELTEVVSGVRFTDRTRLPLAAIDFVHEMDRVAGGTRITHRIVISRPLSPLFGLLLGRGFRKTLPQAVASLGRLAEGHAERPRA